MSERTERILLDFVEVYLHDRGTKANDEEILEPLKRLQIECDVNRTELVDKDYDGISL